MGMDQRRCEAEEGWGKRENKEQRGRNTTHHHHQLLPSLLVPTASYPPSRLPLMCHMTTVPSCAVLPAWLRVLRRTSEEIHVRVLRRSIRVAAAESMQSKRGVVTGVGSGVVLGKA